jgi:acyl-CoA thioesterase-1
LLDRIDLYADTQADIYLLTIGGNDALRRMDLQNLKQNIQEIIDTIYSQNPDAQIVLSGMQIPINYGLSYANNFKKLYSEVAEENNLEFYEFFLEDVAQKSDLNLSDGIHPNEK